MSQQTAILYFSRSPEEEIRSKKLHGNVHTALRVARYLDQRTLSVISSTNLPHFVFRSEDQVGKSPGQKLNHCIEALFQDGFEKLIILGNDCPELKTEDVLLAHQKLETEALVVGPDMKGGTFLMGITKDAYRPEVIENARWGTGLFLSDLIDGFKKHHIHFLSSLNDFNSPFSIRISFKRKNLLRALFDLFKYSIDRTTLKPQYAFLASSSAISRGPPTL